MPKITEKSDVKNIEDLITYIDYRTSNKRKRIYHYTSLNNLILILKNKKLLLNNLKNMNDRMEYKLSSKYTKENLYVASFTYYHIESIHYWVIYGKSSPYAVKVSFKTEDFIHPDDFTYEALDGKKIKLKSAELREMIYHNPKTDKWRNASNYFNNLEESEDVIRKRLRGLCKYNVWEHEKEIRLLASADERFEKIFVNLNEELFNSIQITFSPWLEDAVRVEFEDMLYNILLKHKFKSLPGKEELFKKSELSEQIAPMFPY